MRGLDVYIAATTSAATVGSSILYQGVSEPCGHSVATIATCCKDANPIDEARPLSSPCGSNRL